MLCRCLFKLLFFLKQRRVWPGDYWRVTLVIEVDFYIHNDMLHLADTKVATRLGDFSIRQIHKLSKVQKKD